MATINYSLRSKKDFSSINVRFINGRAYNLATNLPLAVKRKHWDEKRQRIRNVLEVPNRDLINKRLGLLKFHILDAFNKDFSFGEDIDNEWLKDVCYDFFKRPESRENTYADRKNRIYYTNFAFWWLENKASTWLVKKDKYLSEKDIGRYETFVNMVVDYQKARGLKLKIKNINDEMIADFVNYLDKDLKYAASTVSRYLRRFRFFLRRAESMNISVDKSFDNRVFLPKKEDYKYPFFDEQEIQQLFEYDFSFSEALDNVRDNLIIACWTGLRVSDFLNKLDISNFIDDIIEIKTTKTDTPVAISVHPHVKDILIKRKGKLPKHISEVNFNIGARRVCEKVGFKDVMLGGLIDPEINRKVIGLYPKYKLVTSHIGRRSFATNHYGKIPNEVIMGVCGWSDVDMMLHYIQRSNVEHAVELKKYWDEVYS